MGKSWKDVFPTGVTGSLGTIANMGRAGYVSIVQLKPSHNLPPSLLKEPAKYLRNFLHDTMMM